MVKDGTAGITEVYLYIGKVNYFARVFAQTTTLDDYTLVSSGGIAEEEEIININFAKQSPPLVI